MKHTRILLALLVLSGCESPSDVIPGSPASAPAEDQEGRFRVTAALGPESVRGFLPDGRLLFRAFDLPPFGPEWVLVSAPLEEGQVREELAVYRPAFLDDISHLAHDGTRRVLVLWKPSLPRVHGCPDSSITVLGTPGPAPRTPSPVGLAFYALPEVDGRPVSTIPSRVASTNLVAGAGTTDQRVRIFPSLRDADRTGANPFGPVLVPGADLLIYSDGEFLWRASISDTSEAPTLLGEGSYPAISPDGSKLAYARPWGLDSVVTRYVIPLGLAACVEEHVEVTATGWEVVIQELSSGVESVAAQGRDPAWDPSANRVVVRGSELRWVDLAGGAVTSIPATAGAISPVVSADGRTLAFSLIHPTTGADVYFIRLDR